MPPRTESQITAAPRLDAPRFASAWAALVYVVAAMTLAYPALTGAFAAHPRSDQYIAGFGFREFAAQSLRAGQGFPQWDAYLQGGMPYIAAMHGDIFYPTFLLRMIMPTDVAMTWGFIIHLILAGWLTYGFLRALGLSFYAALIGGLAYMMSGPIAAYVSPGHDGKLFVSSLLPLTMWMLLRWMRDGRLWAVGALALTIGLAVLSPHPQLLQYLLLASGSFALFLALTGPLPRLDAFKRLGAALGAVLLGGAIGAVQYLPVRTYVAWSPRAAGGSQTGWEHAVSYSMPIEELLNVVVPEFSGILDAYWGRNQIHFHSEYVGPIVLILAGAGMFAQLFPRGLRWFWIGTLIVSLLWTLGGNTPFYRIVYELVPGTKFFRAPSTMMYVCMFALAVLAAMGTERILSSATSLSRRFILGWGGALLLLVLVALGSAVSVADSIAAAIAAQGYQADWVTEGVRANRGALLSGAIRSLAFAAVTLGLLWFYGQGRIAPRTMAIALGGLLVIDLWSISRKYWNFSRPASESFATDPAIEAIKAAPEPGRVVIADFSRLLGGAVDRTTGRDPLYNGSAVMVHHVRSVTGYHGNELGRYQQLVRQGSKAFLGDRQEFWRHENVHWMYTNLPDSILGPVTQQLGYSGTFTKVLGPVKNASGSTVYLYRVPGENPAAVVASAIVKGADDQALATVMDARFDARRAAIVDTSEQMQTPQLTAIPEPSTVQAKTTRYESGAINVELTAPVQNSGSMLVVSENFYPGWRANVDGNEVGVVRANYNLIGVPLPAGARKVELRFVDPSYGTGKMVTLAAILASIALVIVGVMLDRRRSVAVPA